MSGRNTEYLYRFRESTNKTEERDEEVREQDEARMRKYDEKNSLKNTDYHSALSEKSISISRHFRKIKTLKTSKRPSKRLSRVDSGVQDEILTEQSQREEQK